eukprot:gene23624-9152_t
MAAEESTSQVEIFMNSVALLSSLTREQKLQLVDAFVEEILTREQKLQLVDAFVEEILMQGQKLQLVDAFVEEILHHSTVIKEGETGDKFYIIKDGEAVVFAGDKEVNRLFKADFFGEHALLKDEPRKATVKAKTMLTVLSLDRATFVQVLGPLQKIMDQEKSAENTNQRMAKLKPKSSAAVRRPVAEIILRTGHGHHVNNAIAKGHLDEVLELRRGGIKGTGSYVDSYKRFVLVEHELLGEGSYVDSDKRLVLVEHELLGEGSYVDSDKRLVLVEHELLGEGAFSRVVRVQEDTTGREFAMKRMAKESAAQCPEHVFCEQQITKNMAHPFCLRQYASFQDKFHLYFLFDLMPGGDLMDVLVAEAKVIKFPVDEKSTVKMWQGMEENLSKFYVASIVLALEYLHNGGLVFRDLKPENVLIDSQGYAKLGDFGFAKHVEAGARTYTFCGTPGYVAPENVMGRGYNHSVDWWTLGVLMYVLLTARQPFTSPKTQDPMEVMRRIVDDNLLERKPIKRIGMLQGRANDIKNHPWFQGFDWPALSSRRMMPPRKPKSEDSSKRKAELKDQQKGAKQPTATREEQAEWEVLFKDF